MPSSAFRLPALGLLLALLSDPSPAAANQPSPEAREHHNRGIQLVQQGEHRSAIHEFLSAYRLYATPALLWNVAMAYEVLSANGSLKDLTEARRFYIRYLEERPATVDRREVEARIRALERQIDRRRPKNHGTPTAPEPAPSSAQSHPPKIAPPSPASEGRAAAPASPPPASPTSAPVVPPAAPSAALPPVAAKAPPPPRKRWPLALGLSGGAAVVLAGVAVGVAFALPADAAIPISDFGVGNVRF